MIHPLSLGLHCCAACVLSITSISHAPWAQIADAIAYAIVALGAGLELWSCLQTRHADAAGSPAEHVEL